MTCAPQTDDQRWGHGGVGQLILSWADWNLFVVLIIQFWQFNRTCSSRRISRWSEAEGRRINECRISRSG